jgi:hypothetical protein
LAIEPGMGRGQVFGDMAEAQGPHTGKSVHSKAVSLPG